MRLSSGHKALGVVEPLVEARASLLLGQPELVEPVGHLLRDASHFARGPAVQARGRLQLHSPQAVDLAVTREHAHARIEARQHAVNHEAARLQRPDLLVIRGYGEHCAAMRQYADVRATRIRVWNGFPELPGFKMQPLSEESCRADARVLGLCPDAHSAKRHAALHLLASALPEALEALLHGAPVRAQEGALEGLGGDLEDSASGGCTDRDQPLTQEAE
mmetsp:Transcript_83669/g.222023  ORF Transcript_83669/g.222023 Transcript_83669/m.222023 type:complete len:219 (+) Transcript_83669:413-1069(+)